MFDCKTDYAHNKKEEKAIVYITADETVVLTQADFETEAEFQKWKQWSDENYRDMERQERRCSDLKRKLYLEISEAGSLPSAEELVLSLMDESEKAEQNIKKRNNLRKLFEACLTERQYRRLQLYYLAGLTETEIAKREGVGQQRISKSILAAKRRLKKFLKKVQ